MPSDEELENLTGLDDLAMAARFDKSMLESWIAEGFTRQEAFELLLALKNSTIDVKHHNHKGN